MINRVPVMRLDKYLRFFQLLVAWVVLALSLPMAAHSSDFFQGGSRSKPTFYKGGPIISGTVNVYTLWYGNWSRNNATTIIPFFINNLSGSTYWNFITAYTQANGSSASNSIRWAGTATVSYPYGVSLTDANLQSLVLGEIQNGSFPYDTNGVYLILSSADVADVDPKGKQFCKLVDGQFGYHNHFWSNGNNLVYAFVGDPTQQECSKIFTQYPSPNGNLGADLMVSAIAHEVSESITDPLDNIEPAWAADDDEQADFCAIEKGVSRSLVQFGPWVYNVQPMTKLVSGQPGGCASETPMTNVAMYRFYKRSTGEHFFTLNYNEAVNAGFQYEKIIPVLSDNSLASETQPIYRCYAPSIAKHYISQDINCEGEKFEGLYGYVYSISEPNTIPFYRMYSSQYIDYLETTDASEGYNAGYSMQGILGYVSAGN